MSDEKATSRSESKPQGYRDLLVWQKGMILAREIYSITSRFPAEEKYGLVSQMRRSAVSIPSNISEGQARRSTKEFVLFLSYGEGSLAELDTQLQLSIDLSLLPESDCEIAIGLIAELRKMLNALRRKLVTRH